MLSHLMMVEEAPRFDYLLRRLAICSWIERMQYHPGGPRGHTTQPVGHIQRNRVKIKPGGLD